MPSEGLCSASSASRDNFSLTSHLQDTAVNIPDCASIVTVIAVWLSQDNECHSANQEHSSKLATEAAALQEAIVHAARCQQKQQHIE